MNMLFRLVGPLALGWGLSQLLDPSRGRRRRAVIRDKAVRAAHAVGDAVDTTSRDVTNRTRGVVADLRSRLTRDHADDHVIVERVRAALGTCVRHPRSIEVTAREGRVTLHGPVLADEVTTLLEGVAAVRGVREVDNRLEIHATPDRVPGLQGGRQQRRGGERFELLQRNWSPTARLLTGLAGSALALIGLRHGGVTGTVVGTGGLVLLTRAMTNLELKRLAGIASRRWSSTPPGESKTPVRDQTDSREALG